MVLCGIGTLKQKGLINLTDEEFEKRLDVILEKHQTLGYDWYHYNKAIDSFVIAKSICVLARAINGGEP